MGQKPYGIESSVLKRIAAEIDEVRKRGVKIGIVVGGGNIFRGLDAESYGIPRVPADNIGMLATVINALALGEALKQAGSDSRVMTAIDMNKIAEPYIKERAIHHLEKDRVVLFGGGTGNPFFTTDTAASLRAMEMEAEVLLKATKVDGVYATSPQNDSSAKPFKELTYSEVLRMNLKVMDLTAVSLAMGVGLPIIVFNLRKRGNILKAVAGQEVGTMIRGEGGDERGNTL